MKFVNEYIRELALALLQINKQQLQLMSLINDHNLARKVAETASKDTNPKIRDLAAKVLQGLASSDKIVLVTPPLAPAPVRQGISISAPTPVDTDAFKRQWANMETAAVEVAGPMGPKMVQKIKAQHGGQDPGKLQQVFANLLGAEMTVAILARYKRMI